MGGTVLMTDYNLQRLNILVVEDNRHLRSLIKSVLKSFGIYQIQAASDGAEAFKMLRNFPADLIFTDWEMNPLDGIEFARLVRTAKDSPNHFVPIIMLTGHTEMLRVTQARDAGINEFLAKPITAKKLYSRIAAIVDRPRPFVKTEEYFGPDRRRRADPTYMGPERRKHDIVAEGPEDDHTELTQDEIHVLLKG